MTEKIATMLMFHGDAEAAMKLYTSVFDDARITYISRYGVNEAGPAGTIKVAHFEIMGQRYMAIDSPNKPDFGFTPSMSLFVDFEYAEMLRRAHTKLVDQGSELMPLGNYGFSTLFAWINDRFGVSWQLNLK
jgi:predicted 3-demethylubiquinone-9 3-methyltransferase (glyoxalase superfamily)